jgi:ribonuclease R
VDPLRGQADFSIIEKLSSEPKKRRRQGEDNDFRNRDVRERADRAAAAEALGYVSQPDEDFDDDVPEFVSAHSHMNRGGRDARGGRGKSRGGRFDSDAPSFERTSRGSRNRSSRDSDDGFHVASKPRKGGSRKGAGRSNKSHGRGGRR